MLISGLKGLTRYQINKCPYNCFTKGCTKEMQKRAQQSRQRMFKRRILNTSEINSVEVFY